MPVICNFIWILMNRQTSNISRALVGNTIADHSYIYIYVCVCVYVVTASQPVGAAPSQLYIFILDLTPGLDGFRKDNCKTGRETFKFRDLVHLVLEVWRWYNTFGCTCSCLPIYSYFIGGLPSNFTMDRIIPSRSLTLSVMLTNSVAGPNISSAKSWITSSCVLPDSGKKFSIHSSSCFLAGSKTITVSKASFWLI